MLSKPSTIFQLALLASYGLLGGLSQTGVAIAAEEPAEPILTPETSEDELQRTLLDGDPAFLPQVEASSPESSIPEFADSDASMAQAAEAPERLEALKIPARVNVEHNSSTAGLDGITGIGGFVPLSQEAGENVTFLEGDLQVDNGGHFGWNLSLGYRGINQDEDEKDDRLRGGFIGLDSHFTDESNFYQLAAGYESLGKDWDFRLNGYLPLGDRSRTVDSTTVEGAQTGTSGFVGNQLVLSAAGGAQSVKRIEDSLGGFDAEVATQLSEWQGGELIGAVGGYLLSGKEDTSLGGKLRLGATLASNFNAGIALQHDGIYDTRLSFSIGATFSQLRFQKKEEKEFQETNEVAIRLRDPIQRRQSVAVQERTEVEDLIAPSSEALRNPEEEQDYRFLHVALGASGGDGTYEAPLGTVEEAITLINSDSTTYSDGNTILYVDGEAAPTTAIPGFAIPDRVRVLSQGPQQTIAGMAFPGFPETVTRLPFSSVNNFNIADNSAPNANGVAVLLPDSGDGVFPTITGGSADLVTLGNQTVLAGFNIDAAAQNGVAGSNVTNVELRNNRITSSTASGIALDNVGGSVTLFDNEITGSGDRGILAQNSTTAQSVNITIAGYQLANNRVGMEFNTVANSVSSEVPSQIIAIGPSSADNTSLGNPSGALLTNSILNSTAEGLIVQASGDVLRSSSSQEFSFDQGTIDGSGGAGISFIADLGAHVQELTVTNSSVTNNGDDGISILNGTPPGGATQTAASQEVVIRNSTIDSNAGSGIDINLGDASSQELVIRGNQITNNTGAGISSLAQNVSLQEWRNDVAAGDVGASENVITGNGGVGISVNAQDLAALPVLGIADNELSGNGGASDIAVVTTSSPANPGSPTTCLVIRGNQVSSNIQLTGLTTASTGTFPSFQVQDLANVVAANNGATITFSSSATTTDAAPFEDVSSNCID